MRGKGKWRKDRSEKGEREEGKTRKVVRRKGRVGRVESRKGKRRRGREAFGEWQPLRGPSEREGEAER